MNPKVLLALSQDFVGISRLPRILKRSGLHVSVFSSEKFCIQRSRYVDVRFVASVDSAQTADALCAHLCSVDKPYDMVILGDDPLLEAVARRAGDPWAAALLPLDLSRVEAGCAYSKNSFVRVCESEGLPFPESRQGRGRAEASGAAQAIGFPLIFKTETGYSGSGVKKIESAGDLDRYFAEREFAGAWVMQREILGRVATVDVLFNRGAPMTWVCSYAIKTRNGPFGSSSVRQFFDFPEIRPLLLILGKATGAHGLIGVDFIHEQPSGRIVLLEMNCRPTAGHAVAAQCGVDFGAALCAQLRGETPAPNPILPRPVTVPLFPEDIDRLITDKDGVSFLKWMFFPNYWRCMPWSDPRLLAYHTLDTCGRLGGWALRTIGLKR